MINSQKITYNHMESHWSTWKYFHILIRYIYIDYFLFQVITRQFSDISLKWYEKLLRLNDILNCQISLVLLVFIRCFIVFYELEAWSSLFILLLPVLENALLLWECLCVPLLNRLMQKLLCDFFFLWKHPIIFKIKSL